MTPGTTTDVKQSGADWALASAMPGFVRLHRNDSHWFSNASFSLPLIGAVILLVVGLLTGSGEARGFGLFLLVVAALMVPVVLWTWRATPTAIAVTEQELLSLHNGRVMKRLPWTEVVEVERKETLGNLRWRVLTREGDHIAIEGEIEDVPGLIGEVTHYSGHEEEVAE